MTVRQCSFVLPMLNPYGVASVNAFEPSTKGTPSLMQYRDTNIPRPRNATRPRDHTTLRFIQFLESCLPNAPAQPPRVHVPDKITPHMPPAGGCSGWLGAGGP